MKSNVLSTVDIPLTQGLFSRISADDFDQVSQHKWSASKCCGKYYARRCHSDGSVTYLHRFLMGLEKGERQVVDHINGDPLDNTRPNLRVCSQSANLQNKKMKPHSSPYMGVSLESGKWIARVSRNGKKLYLGSFDSAELAAIAYDLEISRIHGYGARINFGGTK